MPYSIERRDNQWCVIKDATGESIGCHDTEAGAQKQLTAVNLNENFCANAEAATSKYGVTDGDWIRILPVGVFQRFGRKVEVTPDKVREMAANFGHVPDTLLPVNAEHDGASGKLADVVQVEARVDGLWARLGNWISDAAQKVAAGAFQYVSPEIVWGPTDYEGKKASNVLVGLALTNLPYFGKQTAIYSVGGLDMNNEYPEGGNQNIVMALLDALLKAIGMKQAAPEPTTQESAPPVVPDEMVAVKSEMSALSDKFAALQLAHAQTVAELAARTAEAELAARAQNYALTAALHSDLPTILASLEDQAKAEEIAQRFAAFTAQADFSALFAEFGRNGGGQANNDPVKVFEAAIAEETKAGVNYPDAAAKVAREKPELYRAYLAGLGEK